MEANALPFKVSYAQNKEDIFLEYFFRDVKKGFYVDVGANHPNEDSVTKLFYQKGWNGINIEPIKRLHSLLQEERPRDINMNIGISSKNGHINFREYHTYSGLSTANVDLQGEYEDKEDTNYQDYTDHKIEVKTLKDVFTEQKIKHIHFMKVDVEGYEHEVLSSNDWNMYRPEVLCIESNHITNDWRPLLKRASYEKAYNDGLNDYYIAKEAKSLRQFSYIDAVLPYKIIDYRVERDIRTLMRTYTNERNAAWLRNAETEARLHELQHKHMLLLRNHHQSLRLRALLKNLMRKLDSLVEEAIYPSSRRHRLILSAINKPIKKQEDYDNQLNTIREYDKKNAMQLRLESHTVRARTLRAYRALKMPLKAAIKLIIRGLKKTKHIIRGKS